MGPHPIRKMLGSTWPRHDNGPISTQGLRRLTAAQVMNCFAAVVRLFRRLQMPAPGLEASPPSPARQGAQSLLPLLPGKWPSWARAALHPGHLPAPGHTPAGEPIARRGIHLGQLTERFGPAAEPLGVLPDLE